MRYQVCSLREDGDYDVLAGFEDSVMGDYALIAAKAFAEHLVEIDIHPAEGIAIIGWDGDIEVICVERVSGQNIGTMQ